MRKAAGVSDEVVIERRFRGPPDSANGGYTCGLLAGFVEPDRVVEVTLRAPPPLDRPLRVEADGGGARLLDGEAVVAEARPTAEPDVSLPEEVTLEQAEAARRGSPAQRDHPYPTCFVCGPDREPEDGLRVTCGPVGGRGVVAAPWRTHEWMSNGRGVRPELIWSVLDCPSGLAGMLVPELGLTVLGRLTAVLRRTAEPDRSYVAVGWPIERERRKLHSGSAILDPEGEPIAVGRATWIELRDQAPGYGKRN